jgi:hypothetical protein
LHRRAKSARCGKKNIEAVTLRRCDEFFEPIVHLLPRCPAGPLISDHLANGAGWRRAQLCALATARPNRDQ